MLTFVLAHLGAAVLLETGLSLAGYDVFDDAPDSTESLINTHKHRTRVYSYIVLLDFCSKALVSQIKTPGSANQLKSRIQKIVTNYASSRNL